MNKEIIYNQDVQTRIDQFLKLSIPNISRTKIQKLIRDGNIKVDGYVVKPSFILKTGHHISILDTFTSSSTYNLKPENIKLEILYEDDDIIIINKNAGMVTHPAPGNQSGTLVNALLYHCHGQLSGIGGFSRPGIVHRLDFYTDSDVEEIVRRSARILEVDVDPSAAREIARRSRGTPRIANRLLRRVRDYAQVRADGRITADVAKAGLTLLEVDSHGFDEIDRRLLRTIIDKFGGGPVGINTIAAAINEEKDAITDIYEPFLIQAGFLDRTPRGRVATSKAYQYFGLPVPGKDSQLW